MKFKPLVAGLLIVLLCAILIGLILPVGSRPIVDQYSVVQVNLAALGSALNSYDSMYETYPTGDGTSILRKLSGDNPQKVCFIKIGTNSINAAGEFTDPWKTPYAINFPTTNIFVLGSAGPNRIFGDKDDIIFNSVSNDFVIP